jgi:dTDP-4-amino-4,6-dideoxygalactose transaminase
MALDIGPGDAVITTPFTFIATAEVIALAGATPVFVDIDEKTFNIDPDKIKTAAGLLKHGKLPDGSPTSLVCKAIIPVDLFGLTAEYDAIQNLAAEHGLAVIEDAAQSFGASHKGKKANSFGRISATSFFPAKPLGCYGDGGALFTDDTSLAEKIASLRVHGKGSDKYHNVRIGMNSRLDTLQAAILLAKMTIFEDELAEKQAAAARYEKLLKGLVTTPAVPAGCASAFAQYSVRSTKRSEIMAALKNEGIPAAVYYPVPLHLQPAFANLGYREGMLPFSEKISREIFSLPMHAYLSAQEQAEIASVIKGAVA